jgi:DNA uptake protein ComE-like DNA-binding protein
MRRMDDTLRVTSFVGLGVTVALGVAGFANGRADAHAVIAVSGAPPVQQQAASSPETRKVRVVYSGPLTATGVQAADRPARPVAAPASPIAQSEILARPPVVAAPRLAALTDPAQVQSTPPEPVRSGIDLNSASVEQLNSLYGGGRIGKAIVGGRPYASPADLLHKRVLSRATYARIRDQVTVQ